MDLISFLPQAGSFLQMVVAFIVALSIIVAVHEYGHYIVGRWSGIDAEVFSLGFGPVLASRVDRRGTRWQFALLPFGGYVKFRGDSSAASGKDGAAIEAMPPEEARRTMHGAPLWARTATVAAGPIFNFVLSFLIFGAAILWQGQVAEPLRIAELRELPGAYEVQEGDEVLAIGDQPVPDFESEDSFAQFLGDLPVEPSLPYTVRRDGAEMEVAGPYPYPPLVNRVAPRSAAWRAGLEPGDVIVAVDNDPIYAFAQLKEKIEGSNGAPQPLTIWRDGEKLSLVLTPRRVDEPQPGGGFQTQWRIGIVGGLFFTPATELAGVLDAAGAAAAQTWRIVEGSISGLYHMITGAISSCNLSGPVGIAQTSGAMASQGVQSFVWFVAVLSTAVGLLNLFPVPVLDGGHLVFFAYEAVRGRPPSDRALRILMAVGLAMILSLMVFALGNDLFCP